MRPFGLGPTELLIILAIILLLFGPKQIPKLSRMFGKAVKIPMDQFIAEEDIEKTGKITQVLKVNQPVLVHCQRGMRSKTACTILQAQQFTQLNNLSGGLDAWAEAKMPIVKG